MMLLLFGVFFIIFKGNRLIYLLIGFEMLLLRVLFMFRSLLRGIGLILLIFHMVISSVTGVLVLIKVVSRYGSDLTIE